MNNELTIKSIDSTDYSVMSKAMGLSNESNGSSSSSIRLHRNCYYGFPRVHLKGVDAEKKQMKEKEKKKRRLI